MTIPMKTLFVFPLMLLAACSNATTSSPASSSDGPPPATENTIHSLDEKGILPALFPDGSFEGQVFAWKGSEYGGHIAIDTIIHFKQGGTAKAAVVMSHYTWEDGQRQMSPDYLNGLSCAILAKDPDGTWEPTVLKRELMAISSFPVHLTPQVQQAGKDNFVLQATSVLYMNVSGGEDPEEDEAYMNVTDLERVLSLSFGERATFIPSDKAWFDVDHQRYDMERGESKGKVRMTWSATDRKYVPSGKAPMK